MKIAVIGAGIIGISTAYELARDGHQVHVFEQQNASAEGASFAGTGIFAGHGLWPLAPAATSHTSTLRSLCSPQAPRLHNYTNTRALRWLWQWGRCNNQNESAERLKQARLLGCYSQDRLLALTEEANIDFEHSNGQLVLIPNDTQSDALQAHITALKAVNIAVEEVSAAQIQTLEPSLSAPDPAQRALYFPQLAVGNTRQMAQILKQTCQKMGVQFHFQHTVQQLTPGRSAGLLLRGSSSPLAFESIMVCNGVHADALLATHKIPLPLATIYSDSLSANVREPLHAPRHALILAQHDLAISRIGNRIRVRSGMQLGARQHTQPTASATRTLYQALQNHFPAAAQQLTGAQLWRSGFSTSVDGLPLVGPSNAPGIWLNIGHGLQGWGQASGCARLLADQIQGKTTAIDASALQPSRFLT